MFKLIECLIARPLPLHFAAVAAAFAGFGAVKSALDRSYAASKHPVDYATGQTTFDAERIKGFYEVMSEAGTLDIYRQTQMIDFGFIAMMALMGICLGGLVARAAREGSLGRRVGLWAGGLVVFGALMDVCENLTSFIMLADPQGFAPWLALPYSGFAVVKFAAIATGMLGMICAAALAMAGRLAARPRLG